MEESSIERKVSEAGFESEHIPFEFIRTLEEVAQRSRGRFRVIEATIPHCLIDPKFCLSITVVVHEKFHCRVLNRRINDNDLMCGPTIDILTDKQGC